jgi:AcrR family transcriptional regulator
MNAKEVSNKNTKDKILNAARTLFALGGYNGTSIRDIAKSAEVNIAAVNYHFNNKETLYWETFVKSMEGMEESIGGLDQNQSTEDFVMDLFKLMRNNRFEMLNSFKMIISESMPEPSATYQKFCSNSEIGPPGAKSLAQVVRNELGDVAPDVLAKGVKSIFSHTAHIALIVDTTYVKRIAKLNPDMSSDQFEEVIRFHSRAILDYMKRL